MLAGTLLSGLLLGAPAAAAPPDLYHSPADDGASGGLPAPVPADVPVTLHLYLGVGATASTALPCQAGDGDEICGYQLRIQGSGAALQSFVPADPDLLFRLAPAELELIGGEYQTGELGPTKLGDLVVQGPVGATLDLVAGDFVTAALTKESAPAPTTLVQLPEPATAAALACGCALLVALARRGERHPQRALPDRPETPSP
jgi:hypothetical protein